tara:strand:- start:2414 stop:3157 length:744 start_codon:yes stop_codon:yes gene_type:complete
MNTTQPKDIKRMLLILLALFFGGVVPIQLVTLSTGYAQLVMGKIKGPEMIMTAHQLAGWYIPFVYIPAILGLIIIAWYCKTHYPDIFRRIVIGFGIGVLATVGLDFFRQMAVIYKWLPGDTPEMFGMIATGSKNFAWYYSVGFLIHFLNGANFGLIYAFVWGKRSSYKSAIGWAVAWATLVEIGMMTAPPMEPMVGPFGIDYAWPQLFLSTLIAHIAFGIILGIGVQYFLKDSDRRWFWSFLLGKSN